MVKSTKTRASKFKEAQVLPEITTNYEGSQLALVESELENFLSMLPFPGVFRYYTHLSSATLGTSFSHIFLST